MRPDRHSCGMDAATPSPLRTKESRRIGQPRHFLGMAMPTDTAQPFRSGGSHLMHPMRPPAALNRKGMDAAVARGPR